MANQSDTFIDEVTEELRRDRLYGAMRRYGWIVVLVIVAVVTTLMTSPIFEAVYGRHQRVAESV